jgi:hypothetical protein
LKGLGHGLFQQGHTLGRGQGGGALFADDCIVRIIGFAGGANDAHGSTLVCGAMSHDDSSRP